MKLVENTLSQFLDNLASKSPAPGGGSASALAGAMAAALVQMVARKTTGKEKYREVEKEMVKFQRKAGKLQKELLRLVDEDTEAFMEVIKSKGGQKAIQKAAVVPLSTAQKSLAVFRLAKIVSEKGNQNLRSDAFCAIELAAAAIYGALENVRINLPCFEDTKLASKMRSEIERVLDDKGKII